MNSGRGSAVSGAFVFLLLGVFALMSTLMVLVGAQAYRSMVSDTDMHGDARVLTAFAANAVRAADEKGAVAVREIGGKCVLTILEEYDGETYVKYLYSHDGMLRELYTDETYEFDPADGERICEAEGFSARIEGGLLTLEVTDKYNQPHTAQIALRCGE